ncbi:MAG: MMPL family transporter [Acidimicrobiia bacterium]
MSGFLERLGRWCARHPWRTIAAWVLVAVVVGGLAASAKGYSESFTIPGTESQHATDLLKQRFPAQAGATAQVVLHAKSGTLNDPAAAAAIKTSLAHVEQLPGVTAVVSPTEAGANGLSARGDIGYAVVNYSKQGNQIKAKDLNELEAAMQPARDAGLQVEFGGEVAHAGERPDLGSTEIYGLIAAMVVLLLAFGSVVAMGVPIGTALVGLAVGLSTVTVLTNFFDISSIATTIATMIGLGVGIDYALFVVTRHREQLAAGMTVPESAGHANGTSGMAVVFAGTTVVIAICGLVVAGIPMVTSMGFASAVVVAVSVLAAISLLPALLGLAGTKINSLRLPWVKRNQVVAEMHPDRIREGMWVRWAEHVASRPWRYLIASVVVLLALAAPALSMRLGQTDAGTLSTSSTQRRAYDLLGTGFGKGFNGPMLLVAEVPSGGTASLSRLVSDVRADPDVAAVGAPRFNPAGTTAVIRVLPKSSPQAAGTSDLVSRLRSDVIPAAVDGTNVHVYVGGSTAAFIDISDRIASRLPWFIGAVIALSFLLLMVVFRSILVPVKAAIMNVLSIGAAYGVIVAVFQWGWFRGLFGVEQSLPIVSFIPMMMFAILFGLSMDYEVFLLSRVREEWLRTGDARTSVPTGLAATARVITSAALIMICVFLSFVLVDEPTVKMMGLGLATAVFVDATIIRMVLVPATMELLGDANWWLPRWLDRLLPHLDLEGAPEPGPEPVDEPELVGASS